MQNENTTHSLTLQGTFCRDAGRSSASGGAQALKKAPLEGGGATKVWRRGAAAVPTGARKERRPWKPAEPAAASAAATLPATPACTPLTPSSLLPSARAWLHSFCHASHGEAVEVHWQTRSVRQADAEEEEGGEVEGRHTRSWTARWCSSGSSQKLCASAPHAAPHGGAAAAAASDATTRSARARAAAASRREPARGRPRPAAQPPARGRA